MVRHRHALIQKFLPSISLKLTNIISCGLPPWGAAGCSHNFGCNYNRLQFDYFEFKNRSKGLFFIKPFKYFWPISCHESNIYKTGIGRATRKWADIYACILKDEKYFTLNSSEGEQSTADWLIGECVIGWVSRIGIMTDIDLIVDTSRLYISNLQPIIRGLRPNG
jgi:hypothetical protein